MNNGPMRIVTLTSLFPNRAQPSNGIFVANRLAKLLASGEVESRVVAPIPWYPLARLVPGEAGRHIGAPRSADWNGVPVRYPRFFRPPKIGMTMAPYSMARAVRPVITEILRGGYDFDLIDAHYFYPDGVAAAILAKHFGKPLVITARGTDLNLIPAHAIPRRLICRAADTADGLITVCAALREVLLDLGVSGDKVRVLRNGVDLETFVPTDRAAARAALGLHRPTLLSVGHLVVRKGNEITIAALADLPDHELLIVGDGPEEESLRRLARSSGVADRVRFLGRKGHDELPALYAAADALVLASSREGWANVLLEAMACGTPVVASDVWGTPEVVAAPEAGLLMAERTPGALAGAVRRLFAALPDRAATRRYAEGFSWDDTTRGQITLFRRILAERGGANKEETKV